MLTIVIPKQDRWDEKNNEFVTSSKDYTLQLEHSLVSVSKWESKMCKPFLTKTEKTEEENMYYIQCMTLTQNIDAKVYDLLTNENRLDIMNYINAPMSATYFSNASNGKRSNEPPTSELIYYWMVVQSIPFECQKWHLNRLLNLIRICNIKNHPAKKRSSGEILSHNAAMNAARRKQFNTRG